MRYIKMLFILLKLGVKRGQSIHELKHLLRRKGIKKNLNDKDVTVLYKLARRFYKIF